MIVTPDELVERLRAGAKMRPVRWERAAMLSDGYCYIRDKHTFVEHTPRTVGASISPAIVGAANAIRLYGDEWQIVS